MARLTIFCALSLLWLCVLYAHATEVTHDGRAIKIDGKRRILLSGSIHYPRSTPEMWPELIRKGKEGGLDAIETYVFWNAHEPKRRQYDFNGNLDLVRFLKTVQQTGLYAVLRIGPYVCAEWDYGGIPVWVHNLPGVEIRTANDVYMAEMQNFTSVIINMIKEEKLLASQGGPIILAQIENEYGNVMEPYGDAGKAYINWCASMAESFNIGVPWIMCQQSDAPQPMINTCNGWYCDSFTPNNANSPKMWTENWTGWFKNWGGMNPHRTAEDVAYSVAKFFQTGGTFQNYYMYHGGTNFDRTAGGPYITTTYDYDAPLDEYGNIAQPKWGHLKQLHQVLKSMEEVLTYGNVTNQDLGNSVTATTYATDDVTSCFLVNTNTTADTTFDFRGSQFTVPAWSVSILPDCKTEAYNTAKVNVQTSIMAMKANNVESDESPFKWSWRPENVDSHAILGKGHAHAHRILDQKTVADDASDYLWYMASPIINEEDPIWNTDNMTLRINATGQVLHAYVNGEYLDSEWATYNIFNYVFEKSIKLKPGKNVISLLSATIGFQNYKAKFDMVANGIAGPVEIVGRKGDETIIKDLSSTKWSYQVGLHGFHKKLYSPESHSASQWECTEDLPIDRRLTWYKTTFKAPMGTDPVAVDLIGMGKGMAWVNGHSLGRYWPSYLAQEDGCSVEACDYRGSYYPEKCATNCGEPTQRWYHVPRDFLEDGENILVLFEEFGGNPSFVNFQTVVVGTACANVRDNNTLELSCHGRPISDIKFASYGNPQGTCGSFFKGACESQEDVLSIVTNECVGKETCSIRVSEETLGATNCGDYVNRLAVQAVC